MANDTDHTGDLTQEQRARVQELHNIAARIVEDCEVDDDEIAFISDWLERNKAHRETWPISTLFTLLESITEDGKVDQSERLQLMSVFTGLAIFAEK
jgi:hypothetical protein